jgi:hypothetical protein
MIKFQDMTSYVCFTKLNKLKKIEYDLAHRLDSLTAEKNALVITLRSKYTAFSQPLPAATLEVGGKVGPQLPSLASVTPTKKRAIIHSPTPTSKESEEASNFTAENFTRHFLSSRSYSEKEKNKGKFIFPR